VANNRLKKKKNRGGAQAVKSHWYKGGLVPKATKKKTTRGRKKKNARVRQAKEKGEVLGGCVHKGQTTNYKETGIQEVDQK